MTNRRALVVDDDDMMRRLVRTVLEADDFDVTEAANGADALALAVSTPPDVIVLDVMMPGLTGIDVLKQLDHANVKVVMLTARVDPETEAKCREAGADAFLTKPFSSIELLDLIEDLIGE